MTAIATPQKSHPTYDLRYASGKALRSAASRETLAELPAIDRDPMAILEETNHGRLASLLPIRHERMTHSSFAFLRGAAAIMAQDIAAQPAPGVKTQACGDCHLMNFGAFESPEGNILFDINDFDETLPDVDFTADVKRLATSFAVAALDGDETEKGARRIARLAANAYRQRIRKLAHLSPLEMWQSRIHLKREAEQLFDQDLADKLRRTLAKTRGNHDDDDNFPHLSLLSEGQWRIANNPPYIFHVEDSDDPAAHVDISAIFDALYESLTPEVSTLLRRYHLRDSAFKVVGVGSVGTYCAIGLFMTEDDEPLFLQIKEAQSSALERLGGPAWSRTQGERVVTGQRIMQAASDLFLGWTKDPTSNRHFYVRHLKNRKLGTVTELLQEKALPSYATLCGRTLARAHARSADPAVLAGYMGKGEIFDDAIASFAMLYAKQNAKDYARFLETPAFAQSKNA
jgi:uncharacterized protein (DUF2252 family)